MWKPQRRILAALQLALRVRKRCSDRSLFTHSAAMAFFLVFSLPPMALIFVVLVTLLPMQGVIGDTSLVETIQEQLYKSLPRKPAEVIGGFVEVYVEDSAAAIEGVFQRKPLQRAGVLFGDDASPLARRLVAVLRNGRPWLLLLGFLAILWSASGATRSAMEAMDAIHGVPSRSVARQVGMSLALTFGLVVCSTLSMAILTLGNLAAGVVVEHHSLSVWLLHVWRGANWLLGLALMLATIAVLQRFGPSVKLRFRDVLHGGVTTIVLLFGLSYALKTYTEHGWDTYDATWGALASALVLLMWCYCSAAATLVGVGVNAERLEARAQAKRPRKSKRASPRRPSRRAA